MIARGNTAGARWLCFRTKRGTVGARRERIGNVDAISGIRHESVFLQQARMRRRRRSSLLLPLLLLLCSASAGAVDLEELKRLARLDATAQVQQEAADKAKQDAAELVARPANQQMLPKTPKPAALSGTASQMEKLAKGIEAAHAAAPNRWYQAARIEDVTPPGDDQRKIYKITTALGEYCVRYKDKNKADQGLANAGAPLIGACPHMF